MRLAHQLLRIALRRFPEMLLTLGVCTAIALAAYLYRTLYQTLTDAAAIVTLRTTIAIEDFDRDQLAAIEALIRAQDARAPINPESIRDIFSTSATPQPPGEVRHPNTAVPRSTAPAPSPRRSDQRN